MEWDIIIFAALHFLQLAAKWKDHKIFTEQLKIPFIILKTILVSPWSRLSQLTGGPMLWIPVNMEHLRVCNYKPVITFFRIKVLHVYLLQKSCHASVFGVLLF